MKKPSKKPIAIDLFSGCGGLTCGLKKAGFDVVAAVEIDEKAKATYRMNHPKVELYGQDIRKLNPRKILIDQGLKPGDLDLLAGCPPCQGFSRLRTKNQSDSVTDKRNALVNDFIRFVRVLRPKTVMMENVPSLQYDLRFRRLQKDLAGLGYTISTQILDAADYKVPQRRKRLILLASRVHEPSIARPSRIKRTVRDAIWSLENPALSKDGLHRLGENRSLAVRRLIALIPKDGGSRSDLGRRLQLDCHKRNDGFNDVYGRMRWDDVSPTITSGCSNPSKGRFLHPSKNRAITLREAALLQGFPKSYKFDIGHGKESIALMIGNALPPPLIAAHAAALKRGIENSVLR